MVRALARTVRGKGSSPSRRYILFILSALVVYKKTYYMIIHLISNFVDIGILKLNHLKR